MSTPPVPYKTPITDSMTGLLTVPWQAWFRELFAQVGGSTSSPLSNPMTTAGDIIYGASSGTPTRLAGSITAAKRFLGQTGTGVASAAPVWTTILAADLPTPTTGAIGGVQAVDAVLSNWISYIDTSGVPHLSQPDFTDLSGDLALAQLPSELSWPSSGTILSSTPNEHGVLVSGTGSATTVIAPDASTAFPLVSGGASADPSWALLTVPGGGTGAASFTANGMIYGGGVGALGVTGAGLQYQVFQAGAAGVPTVGAVALNQAAAVTGVLPNGNTTADSANTASAIVARDGSGNFAAGTITAALTGAASSNLLIASNLSDVNNAQTAFNNISGLTTLGDLIYGGASGTRTRLAGNTTNTKKFLVQTGTGLISAAPVWDTIASGDLPTVVSGTSIYTVAINPAGDSPYALGGADSGHTFLVTSANGAMVFNLPAPSANYIIEVKDISGNFNTNSVTFVRNGSELIEGVAANYVGTSRWGRYTIYSDGTNWYFR